MRELIIDVVDKSTEVGEKKKIFGQICDTRNKMMQEEVHGIVRDIVTMALEHRKPPEVSKKKEVGGDRPLTTQRIPTNLQRRQEELDLKNKKMKKERRIQMKKEEVIAREGMRTWLGKNKSSSEKQIIKYTKLPENNKKTVKEMKKMFEDMEKDDVKEKEAENNAKKQGLVSKLKIRFQPAPKIKKKPFRDPN